MRRIILASTSPRRKEILSKTDLPFEVFPSEYEEDMSLDMGAAALAKHLSLGKAKSIAHKYDNALIISADTFVSLEDKKLGKPHTPDKARAMLAMMSGKPHVVITGLTIIDTADNRIYSDIEETKVYFKNLVTKDVEEYIASGKPLDKAGSYGIQEIGDKFVEKVEGDYFNIMGLPLEKLVKVLNDEFQVAVSINRM